MTEKERIKRKILLIKQSLQLSQLYKKQWVKKLGSEAAYEVWLDEQLESLSKLLSQLD